MKRYTNHFLFALRVMAKTPLITMLSIAVLSIAIAQVSLMFNMIESVVMSKLPYDGSDRLMRIMRDNPQNPNANSSFPHETFERFKELDNGLEGTIAMFNDNVILKDGEKGRQLGVPYIETNFLELLGVEPIMGRTFTPEDAEPDATPTLLISHQLWSEFFANDPNILGRTVQADGIIRTIIGVTPKGFDFPFTNQAWIPLNTATVTEQVGWGSEVFLLGKTRGDISPELALQQANDAFMKVKELLPVENTNYESIEFQHFKELFVNQQTRMLFLSMAICAILILFMACAIVSNLITVRSAKRANELAIRSALGASRTQIVNQMLFESLIISAISLVLGWLLMQWFHTEVFLDYYVQFNVPSWFFKEEYSFRHFLFVIIIPVIVTVASTLVPAMRASKTTLADLLRDSTRTGSSLKMTILGRLLIIFQIAAACAVVTGGAIVGYFLHDINSQDLTYDPDEFLYAQLGMDANMYETHQERAVMLKKVMQELNAFPEVQGAAYSTELFTGGITVPLEIVGEDYASTDDFPVFYRWVVSPGYFELMGAPLIAGREFTELDDKERPYVAIVTDVFAKQVWGNENPIGKQMIYRDGDEEWTLNVIGVSQDIFKSERDRNQRTGFFLCSFQDVWFDFGIHMKIPNSPKAFESNLVRTVADIDSRVLISHVETFTERIRGFQISLRFIFVLFSTFAVGALIMATAGLYGVVSFSVSQKIREIGIRLALGASPGHVILRVFREGLINVAVGVVFGVLAAFLIRFMLMNILQPLFESTVVYMGVLLLILIISSVAILIPAIRGGNTDPAEALRID